MEWTWAQTCPNIRTVGSGGIRLLHADFKDQNILDIIVLIK